MPGGTVLVLSLVLIAGAYGAWSYLSSHDYAVGDLVPEVPERLQRMVGLTERPPVPEATDLDGEAGEFGGARASADRPEQASGPDDRAGDAQSSGGGSAGGALETEQVADLPETSPDMDQPATAPDDGGGGPDLAGNDRAETGPAAGSDAERAASAVPEADAGSGSGTAPAGSARTQAEPAAPEAPEGASGRAETPAPPETGTGATGSSADANGSLDTGDGGAGAGGAPAAPDTGPETEATETAPAETATADTDAAEPTEPASGETNAAAPAPQASPVAAEEGTGPPAVPERGQADSGIPAAPEQTQTAAGDPGDRPDGRSFGADAAAARITLTATARSWVQVRGPDDSLMLTRLLRPGDRYHVPDRDGLTLHTGNAGGLEVWVDGRKVGRLGADGEVRRGILLEPGALQAGG
jgi:hypothetical protein